MRESELVMLTRAGPEIGVASTKAFTTQLTALGMLVIALARHNGGDAERERGLVSRLIELPGLIEKTLELDPVISKLAAAVRRQAPRAVPRPRRAARRSRMEGALKLKEISYIHAEAYAAGELKHGPLALVDADMPVITVAPEQRPAREAEVEPDGSARARRRAVRVRRSGLRLPVERRRARDPDAASTSSYFQAPIVYTIPLQLLAYHVAILRGTDVDQPRNLAKSVTVE